MKNHFYIPYFGNKRSEVIDIVKCIPKLETYETIIEPFCGSCAISYYIWTLYPDKKFILNDNNVYLKEMYEIIKDDEKIKEFEDHINGYVFDNVLDTKEHYLQYLKNKDVKSWFVASKYYNIRPGLYDNSGSKKKKLFIKDYSICNFFKEANIIFTSDDSIKCYELYKNEKLNCIIMDPPYLMTCNDFYNEKDVNIYEYLCNNDINNENAFICLILEDIWIMRLLLFPKIKYNIIKYNKQYLTTHKKTVHMVITNDF